MHQLAAVHVHAAHLGAAVQRGHRLAGIEQSMQVEGFLEIRKCLGC